MLQFSLVFMLQNRGRRQKTRLMTDIITFGVGNSTILNQDGKMKILSHVACFYSKCLAKMKNERPAWQCFLTTISQQSKIDWFVSQELCYCSTSFDFKNLSSALKSFRAFRETGPRPGILPEHYLRTPRHTQEHPQRAWFPLENPDPLLQKMGKKLHNQQN